MSKNLGTAEEKVELERIKKLMRLREEANASKTPIISTPTMLQPEEQKFLYLLAKEYYDGKGAIFDAGICLGGCTECFSKGLAARSSLPKTDEPILYSYELGQADGNYVSEFIKGAYGVERKFGEDFTDIIEKNLSAFPLHECIKFYGGDILQSPYPDTIEIMFLDVCKTKEINYKMAQLFNRMIPGQSVLIQQDYFHSWSPYIHTTLGYLKDYFVPLGQVWYASFVFFYKKEIPAEVLQIDPFDHFPLEELKEMMREYYPLMSQPAQTHMECAIAHLLLEKGMPKEAMKTLEALKDRTDLPWDYQASRKYILERQ